MITTFDDFINLAVQVIGGGVLIGFMAWLIGWTADAALSLFHK